MSYDLLLKNVHLVDPGNNRDERADVAIHRGKIARLDANISEATATRTWDLNGKVVAPALIDAHMHTTLGPGGEAAFAMLARAGVATAIDFAGPPAKVMDLVAGHGSGITIGCLQVLRPAFDGQEHAFSSGPDTVIPTNHPGPEEIRRAVNRGLHEGAIGTKILGGHFPFTPEATEEIIDETVAMGVYMALHVGTTETGSNLAGLTEAIGMAKSTRRLHLCHINSALRGQILPSRLEEASQAMDLLAQAGDAVISESFLTRWSPDPGLCVNGIPDSAIVCTSLEIGGYEPTEAGLEKAIREGFTVVIIPQADNNIVAQGEVGFRYWREMNTDTGIAFPISFADVGLICATQKRSDGQFTVTAIASDSGQLPFNVTLDHGLTLVQFGALSLDELIYKASYAPSRMLGLIEKGHLGEGADADIVVIDVDRRRADHLLVGGKLVMTDGLVVGHGGTFLTSEAGVRSVAQHGLPHRVIDFSKSLLYQTS